MLNDDKITQDNKIETYSGEFETTGAVLSSLREQIDELEKKLRMARGTGDVTAQAETAAKRQPTTIEEQVERLLRHEILTTSAISKALAIPVGKVTEILKRKRPQIANLGSPDQARWSWRIGDKSTTKEIYDLVERLISDSPMSFREIVSASGVRDGLVQGALIEIRRARTDILNLGTQARGRWFIPAKARPAHLTPKGSKPLLK